MSEGCETKVSVVTFVVSWETWAHWGREQWLQLCRAKPPRGRLAVAFFLPRPWFFSNNFCLRKYLLYVSYLMWHINKKIYKETISASLSNLTTASIGSGGDWSSDCHWAPTRCPLHPPPANLAAAHLVRQRNGRAQARRGPRGKPSIHQDSSPNMQVQPRESHWAFFHERQELLSAIEDKLVGFYFLFWVFFFLFCFPLVFQCFKWLYCQSAWNCSFPKLKDF